MRINQSACTCTILTAASGCIVNTLLLVSVNDAWAETCTWLRPKQNSYTVNCNKNIHLSSLISFAIYATTKNHQSSTNWSICMWPWHFCSLWHFAFVYEKDACRGLHIHNCFMLLFLYASLSFAVLLSLNLFTFLLLFLYNLKCVVR